MTFQTGVAKGTFDQVSQFHVMTESADDEASPAAALPHLHLPQKSTWQPLRETANPAGSPHGISQDDKITPEVLQPNRFSSSKGLRVPGGSVNGRKFQAIPGGIPLKHVETIGMDL